MFGQSPSITTSGTFSDEPVPCGRCDNVAWSALMREKAGKGMVRVAVPMPQDCAKCRSFIETWMNGGPLAVCCGGPIKKAEVYLNSVFVDECLKQSMAVRGMNADKNLQTTIMQTIRRVYNGRPDMAVTLPYVAQCIIRRTQIVSPGCYEGGERTRLIDDYVPVKEDIKEDQPGPETTGPVTTGACPNTPESTGNEPEPEKCTSPKSDRQVAKALLCDLYTRVAVGPAPGLVKADEEEHPEDGPVLGRVLERKVPEFVERDLGVAGLAGGQVLYGALAKPPSGVMKDGFVFKNGEVIGEPKICAIEIGCGKPKEVQLWTNTPAGVNTAVRERFERGHVDPKFAVLKRHEPAIKFWVAEVVRDVSKDHVRELVLNCNGYQELKKGWSTARFEECMKQLQTVTGFEPVQGNVKLEVGKPEKAPRCVMNVGEIRQLACLLTVHQVSKGYFHGMGEGAHIKEMDKEVAVERIFGKFASVKPFYDNKKRFCYRVIEGDGSSWEFTCSLLIRKLIEYPVLEEAWRVVRDYLTECIPLELLDEAFDERWTKKTKVKGGPKVKDGAFNDKMWEMLIPTTRLSGDAFTSVLNHVINSTIWRALLLEATPDNVREIRKAGRVCAGLAEGHSVPIVTYVDRRKGYYADGYEGDDSGIEISRSDPVSTDALIDKAEESWKGLGFRMKIFKRGPGELMTFVGWTVLIDENGRPTTIGCPDLDRTLKSWSWSTSRELINSAQLAMTTFKNHDIDLFEKLRRETAATNFHARALSFKNNLTPIASVFERMRDAMEINSATVRDKDTAFKLGVDVGHEVKFCRVVDDLAMWTWEQKRERFNALLESGGFKPLSASDELNMLGPDALEPAVGAFMFGKLR